MDDAVRKRVSEIQKSLEGDELRISMSDPVAKMMLVALAHQTNEIERKMNSSIDRLAKRFVNELLMNSSYGPQPAVSLLKIGNGKEYTPYKLDEKVAFGLKSAKCNFRPLVKSLVIPGRVVGSYANGRIMFPYEPSIGLQTGVPLHKDEMWIAYEAASEVETFEDVIIAFNHPLSTKSGLKARIGRNNYHLSLLVEDDMYLLPNNLMLSEYWKQYLINHRLWIYRFGPSDSDMPVITSEMPGWLYDMFEPETLSRFTAHRYIWIKISGIDTTDFPLDSHLEFNCMPVANYDINSVKLSYTEPIKALDNPKTGSQFLELIPEPELAKEFFIRDFDVEQYDNNRITDDITNLYRHYVDDYYAFVDSNSLNDGAVLRNLRMAMVQVSDALSEIKKGQKQFTGTYAIRNPHNNNQPIVIGYVTTQGARGNLLKAGTMLTGSFSGCGEIVALTDAVGGRNKINGIIGKKELAKYIANSNERLFTEIDILQYCKVELIRAFGDDVLRFCEISTQIKSIPVDNHIEKCLFINISVHSERYYEAMKEFNFKDYLEWNINTRKSSAYKIDVAVEST